MHANNLYKKPLHTNNSHKHHHTNPETNIIITRINIFVVINQINKHKPKIYIITRIPKSLSKNIYFFSLIEYKNEGNSINFDDKKIKQSDLYNSKNKKIFDIDDIDVSKILVSKKEQYGNMVKIIHLNTLLGILIMMVLNHYI